MNNEIKMKSLDEVAVMMVGTHPESKEAQTAKAEFLRRQTQAIQDTATATKKYAIYTFITVMLMLFTVIMTLIFNYLNYIKK